MYVLSCRSAGGARGTIGTLDHPKPTVESPPMAPPIAKATDWAAVAAWAAVATAFIYVGLGIFAWRQLREARRLREEQARLARESWEEQARLARESQAEQARQAQELREEQARPFVIVDFDHVDMLFLLVIENVGRTMARNVVIKFDKPLTTTIERPRELDEAALFREPIPSLPPGKKLHVPFDTLLPESRTTCHSPTR